MTDSRAGPPSARRGEDVAELRRAGRGPPGSRPICPRCSRDSRPASTRTERWWLTVGWERPSGSTRSQAQASPLGTLATMENSRSRAGSASALKAAASSTACGSLRAAEVRGSQHDLDRLGGVHGRLLQTMY